MKLGKGVVINMSCDNDIRMVRFFKRVANENHIPFQLCTNLAATGGTDTAAVQLTGKGVCTISLSIPCRYMHTPVEVCDTRDVQSAIELIVAAVSSLESLLSLE